MPPRKRARRTAASSSSTTAAPKITLRGGEAHHSSLAGLWRKEKLTDITVCAEGVEFKAHRAALASSSGYFLSLFDSGMRDAASATHAIEGLRSPVLEALLGFVYEGSCQVEAGLLTEMLDASARLVVDPLKAACAYAIQAQLAPCNALDVWRIADLYTLPSLEKAAITSALGGFEELPLQSASSAQVLTLVQEDRLVAKDEEAVFQWVAQWQEAVQPTEAELLAVMKHLRFAAMEMGFVQTTVRTCSGSALVSKEAREEACDILGACLEAGHAVRRSGFGPRLVYVLGGVTGPGDPQSTVEVYDPLTGALKQASSMPIKRFQHGGVALGGKIYVFGGCDGGGDTVSTADVYDPQSDLWQPVADMAIGRANFAAAVAGDKIYAIGGILVCGEEDDIMAATAMVQAFDPLLGTWAEVASMSVHRVYHASAVVDGKIYAIGGCPDDTTDTHHTLDSVEVYDPQANNWQLVASMPGGRQMHAATAMGGKIYVSGGSFGVGGDGDFTSSVTVFDPQANTWTELASMIQARADHTSAVMGGKLYVFGGYVEHGLTDSAEVYDPVSNMWASTGPWHWAGEREQFVAVAL